jgi:hypothetical protein
MKSMSIHTKKKQDNVLLHIDVTLTTGEMEYASTAGLHSQCLYFSPTASSSCVTAYP